MEKTRAYMHRPLGRTRARHPLLCQCRLLLLHLLLLRRLRLHSLRRVDVDDDAAVRFVDVNCLPLLNTCSFQTWVVKKPLVVCRPDPAGVHLNLCRCAATCSQLGAPRALSVKASNSFATSSMYCLARLVTEPARSRGNISAPASARRPVVSRLRVGDPPEASAHTNPTSDVKLATDIRHPNPIQGIFREHPATRITSLSPKATQHCGV